MPNEEEIKKLEEQKKALEAEMKAKAEAEAKLKAEEEAKKKAEEEAKAKAQANSGEQKTDDKSADPKGNGRSIDDYVLKEDLQKMFNPFTEKIDALLNKANQLDAENKQLAEEKAKLEKEKADLESQKAQKEAELKDIEQKLQGYKDKYENAPFGNLNNKGIVNPTNKPNNGYRSFEELSAPFMN